MRRWYALQIRPGEEQAAAEKLRMAGYQVLLPKAVRAIRSGGSLREQETLLLPGYVTVNTAYDAANYYRIRELQEVLRFVGNGAESYLSYAEAEWLRLLSKNSPIGSSKIRKREDGSFEILSGILRFFPESAVRFFPRERKAMLRLRFGGEEKQAVLPIETEDEMKEQDAPEQAGDKEMTKVDG